MFEKGTVREEEGIRDTGYATIAHRSRLTNYIPPSMIHQPYPEHHDPRGGFQNPWPQAPRPVFTGLLRWAITRTLKPRLDRTRRGTFPAAAPAFAMPRAEPAETSLTWIGHATFLIQIGGLNVLTDPMWSERPSPVRFAGPRRYMAPGVPLEDLPPIDVVLLTHDHYDHLDEPTVERLVAEQATAEWLAPLGLGSWLKGRGVAQVHELDWWAQIERDALRITSVPAQHFSGRGFRRNQALWCGWTLEASDHRVCFAGDTGLHPEFREIGERLGPFDLAVLPIGAYDPRWFMAPVHMDPDDAVTAFRELTATRTKRCRLVGMHWGTFKLTDEPMTEPPQRTRAAWQSTGLPAGDLWILAHGETRWISP